MKLSAERKVQLGFGFALLCLAAIGAVSLLSVFRLDGDLVSVRRSEESISSLRLLLATIADAESAQRGHTITGDESFLGAFEANRAKITGALLELRTLTGGNSALRMQMDTLEPLVARRLAVAWQIAEVRRSHGFAAAQRVTAAGTGRAFQEKVIKVIGEMETTEREWLKDRQIRAQQTTTLAKIVVIGGSGVALLVVVGALIAIQRDFAGSRRAGAALHAAHDELETRVQTRTAELSTANAGLQSEINERRRVELALEGERTLLRTLIDAIPDLIYVKDHESRFLLANASVAQLMGASVPADVLGKTDAAFYPAAVAARYRADERRVFAGDRILDQEESTPDGNRVFLTTKLPLRDASGKITALVGTGREITERKQAEESLRQSERRFREMLETVEMMAMTLDKQGTVTFCNDHLLRVTGWRREEVIGSDWFTRFLPEDMGAVKKVFFDTIETGTIPAHYENPIRTKAGDLRQIMWNNTMLRDRAGNLIGTASLGEDITDRKRSELRQKLQHDVTAVLAETTSPAETNRRVLEVLGRGLQQQVGELWTVDRAAKVLRCIETWQPLSFEFDDFVAAARQMTFSPGTGRPGRVWAAGLSEWSHDIAQDPRCVQATSANQIGLRSWIGFPIRLRNDIIGVAGFFGARVEPPDQEMLSTLTALGMQLGQQIERQQLTEQIRQAQKMEAIGTLAGGIAHDFNNIIAAITGYTELAKTETDAKELAAHHEAVLTGATRAAGLVRQILAFSRQQPQERKPIQLRHVVAEAADLLRATIPTTIEFHVSLGTDLPVVMADATQIHQVVMNLCTNAWQAIKQPSGRIGVILERWEVNAEFAETHPGFRADSYVRLSVSDTGCGMDSATLSRVFEPFFTTKAPGEGTGLGLAVVHGIMQSHEGVVNVYSQPGEGTVFRLYFPVCASETAEVATDPAHVPHGRGERILCVDDEEPLARMSQKILRKLGYAADAMTSANAAIEAIRSNPQHYDLVITDLAMPVLTGVQLARALIAIRPDLPVILVTGYTATLTAGAVQAMGVRELLLKPLSVYALDTAVHRILTEAKPR